MLSSTEKSLLIHVSRTDAFNALKSLALELIAQWDKQTPSKLSEFEYLHSSIIRDGKKEGVNLFLQSLERLNDGSDLKIKNNRSI